MRSLSVPALLIAAALAVSACGSSSSPTPSSGGSAAPSAAPSAAAAACETAPAGATAAATVTIRGFKFDPATVTIKAGEAVAWTNEDSASHTATSLDGGCDTNPISKGATVALVFPKAGTYQYHCKIHATMPTATIEVTE